MTERSTTKLSDVITRSGLVAWSAVGVLALGWALLWILAKAQVLIAPTVLAVAMIYILNPLVNRMVDARVPRFFATILAFLILLGALVLAGLLIVPSIREQASGLGTDFPQIYEDSARQVEDLGDALGFSVTIWSYEEVEEFVTDPETQETVVDAVMARIGAVTSGLFEAVLVIFLAPVLALYILLDLPRIRRETVGLIPADHREEVVFVSARLGQAVGGFLRGQVFVALIVGVLMSFGFWLIGLDFWLIIGMISGFLNIIPFVGPWVGGALGVTVGLVTGSLSTAIAAAVVALVVQQIDNNFVSPTVLRATVRLHPAAVILVLILGGAVGGLWGVILAVPVAAAIKIVVGHLWRTRVLGQTWEEAAEDQHVPPPEPAWKRRRAELAALVDPDDPDPELRDDDDTDEPDMADAATVDDPPG